MAEPDGYDDELSHDETPDCIQPRASRSRRSGVILSGGSQDSEAILMDLVKAAPRRSSIIKVNNNIYDTAVVFKCFSRWEIINKHSWKGTEKWQIVT